MTPELETDLQSRYPDLFRAFRGQIECEDGWAALIDCLCAVLMRQTIHDNCLPTVTVIKQKFGRLRVSLVSDRECSQKAWDAYQDAITFAEDLSVRICETCGTIHPDDHVRMRNVNGWLSVRCDVCAEEQ